MINYAEQTAHAFLGENAKGPYKKHSVVERGLAHGLGYATAPLRKGMEWISGAISKYVPREKSYYEQHPQGARVYGKAAVAPPFHKSFNKSTMVKGKKKIKKQIKKEIKKEAKQLRRAPFKKIGFSQRFSSVRRLQRQPRGRGGRGYVGIGQRPGQIIRSRYTPPVAYSYNKNTGSSLGFSQPSREGCIKMHGRYRIGFLATDNGTAVFNTRNFLTNSDVSNVKVLFPVAPWNFLCVPSTVYQMTSLFQKFKMRVRLQYVPACPTSQPGVIQVVWIPDPFAYTNQLNASNVIGPFTQQSLDSIGNSTEFSVIRTWMSPWRVVTGVGGEMQSMTGELFPDDNLETVLAFTADSTPTIDPAVIRSQIGGMFLFRGGAFGDVSVPLGDIFVHYELEMCDVIAPQITSDSPLEAIRKRRERREDAKRLKDSTPLLLRLLEKMEVDDGEEKKVVKSSSHKSGSSLKIKRMEDELKIK